MIGVRWIGPFSLAYYAWRHPLGASTRVLPGSRAAQARARSMPCDHLPGFVIVEWAQDFGPDGAPWDLPFGGDWTPGAEQGGRPTPDGGEEREDDDPPWIDVDATDGHLSDRQRARLGLR